MVFLMVLYHQLMLVVLEDHDFAENDWNSAGQLSWCTSLLLHCFCLNYISWHQGRNYLKVGFVYLGFFKKKRKKKIPPSWGLVADTK